MMIDHDPHPERSPSWTVLHDVAKDASLRAAKNSGAAPQLLFAPILFALWAAFPNLKYQKRAVRRSNTP